MKATDVKFGDIIHSNDDTMIEVHSIGEDGEVFYLSYADGARGELGKPPYIDYYGFIQECRECTENEKELYKILKGKLMYK